MKTYSELIQLPDILDRYRYLRIGGKIGDATFGKYRWLNQVFYESKEWRSFRRDIILRDNGCDLAVSDRPIDGKVFIHHLEPITMDDIKYRRLEKILNPENVVCCSFDTHQAIHYSNENLIIMPYVERKPGDTCLWKTC